MPGWCTRRLRVVALRHRPGSGARLRRPQQPPWGHYPDAHLGSVPSPDELRPELIQVVRLRSKGLRRRKRVGGAFERRPDLPKAPQVFDCPEQEQPENGDDNHATPKTLVTEPLGHGILIPNRCWYRKHQCHWRTMGNPVSDVRPCDFVQRVTRAPDLNLCCSAVLPHLGIPSALSESRSRVRICHGRSASRGSHTRSRSTL